MAWTDRLRLASFRGAAFRVDAAEISGGRRTVTHEYPLRDEPYIEDMGLRARRFPVDAYVVGESYAIQRDALIAALEQAGPGELVHPYHGSRQVICSGFRVRESREEGRMARFSIDFEEATFSPILPAASLDTAALVASAADDGLLATAEAFLAAYDVTGQPQFVLDSIADIIRDASTLLGKLFGPAIQTTQLSAAMKRILDALYLDADDLARDPAGIVSDLQGAVTSLATQPATPTLGLSALLESYGLSSGADPLPITQTRQQELTNRTATFDLFKRTAIIEAARTATQIEFESYDDAIAARDSITVKLDEQAEIAPDDVFAALNHLRKELVRAVPGEDNDLPRQATHTPSETVPSLVLSHQLYGDIAHESDILRRNSIRHPGFIVGSQPLEILTDG